MLFDSNLKKLRSAPYICGITATFDQFIGLAVSVFANGPGDQDSIPGRVILKTQKMVIDVSLLNTQHINV